MVVSIDISGILEERLRRLVELGLYASISEAVRDALRKLMDELDLREISLSLYTTRDITLHYACYFSGTPCWLLVDYFLSKGVVPVMGEPRDVVPAPPGEYVLDKSSLYVLYNSYAARVLAPLRDAGYKFYVTEYGSSYVEVLEARALYKGLLKLLLEFNKIKLCNKKFKLSNSKVIVEPEEEAIARVAGSCGTPVIASDIRYRAYLEENGIPSVSVLSLVIAARNRGIIDEEEFGEIIMSMRAVPIIIPPTLRL